MAFDADYEAMLITAARWDRLESAFGLVVEIGDWDRFTGATTGAYLGLTPSKYFSGASRVRGSITKTGDTHARRLLVEMACHHRRPPATPAPPGKPADRTPRQQPPGSVAGPG